MVGFINEIDTYTVILLLTLAAMLALMVLSMIPRRAGQQEKPPIKTLITCVNGHMVERDFTKGDYVGKKVKCPQCGKEATITAIYIKQGSATEKTLKAVHTQISTGGPDHSGQETPGLVRSRKLSWPRWGRQ